MANLFEDIQCGKENGVNILKSIDEGTFQMGTFRETLAEGEEGTTTVQDGRVVDQNVQGQQNKGHRNNARGTCAVGNGGAQNKVRNVNPGQARQIKYYNCNVLDEEQLLFIAGGQDNVVDEDMDDPPVPTAQTMFMANLSSINPIYNKAVTSYDSEILSEVHNHDNYQDSICELHEVHEMHDNVQPNCVVDSDAAYTSDSNMILYDQYVKDNVESVVQNNVSYVPNDASMLIINEMHEQTALCVSVKAHTKVVDASLTAKLTIYREQVELYKRRTKFELTEREQKIKEQLRIVIIDRNIKEENLKKELHFVKMQLNSTINHNKSMRKVAIGYKNSLYLTRAKQVQPALYNGHEIIKSHHVLAIVHNSEDTLEITEITRKKMNDKMKTPLWTEQNINIRPPDYSKENYLATFTPQTQLTLKQIFWSRDVLKIKAKALKEQTKASKPIKALMVYPPNIHATLVLRALTKEIKEMKEFFEELEAKVDQNVVNRKCDEIERKNLLIANDNLIADCLSNEVVYIATNFELTVSRFTELHDAHTVVQARCLELKAELSKLNYKIKKDDHNELVKRFSKLEITRAKHIDQTAALITKNENLKVQINEKMKCVTMDFVKPKVLAPGVNSCTDATGSKPRSNTKTNRISPANSVHKKKVKEHPRKRYSKHITWDRLRLRNFVKKFIETVIFGNDHFGAIMGYGDCVIGDNVISNVYYVEGLGHNLSFVGQFYDFNLEVAFRKHSCYVRDIDGVELIKGSRGSNFYTILVEDMLKSSPICLLSKASKNKSWLWHHRLNHLNFGTINDLARKDLSSSELQHPISHQGVAAGSTIIEDNPFAHADIDPFVNVFAPEPSFEASSYRDASSAESTHVTQPHCKESIKPI
nr:retrovirus-related Pol polyprotein from transposon TNT 1-94 [Tanacetum cinerariifolium]